VSELDNALATAIAHDGPAIVEVIGCGTDLITVILDDAERDPTSQ
jgi:hypothetical protein